MRQSTVSRKQIANTSKQIVVVCRCELALGAMKQPCLLGTCFACMKELLL